MLILRGEYKLGADNSLPASYLIILENAESLRQWRVSGEWGGGGERIKIYIY